MTLLCLSVVIWLDDEMLLKPIEDEKICKRLSKTRVSEVALTNLDSVGICDGDSVSNADALAAVMVEVAKAVSNPLVGAIRTALWVPDDADMVDKMSPIVLTMFEVRIENKLDVTGVSEI